MVSEMKTGGTSKARREQIKGGIEHVKKVLPLNQTDSESLSQLQTLHCSCTYIRKMELFKKLKLNNVNDDLQNQNVRDLLGTQLAFSETLFGFVIVLSKDRHLLYVSDNVVDYLGLRAIEVLLSCESFEDILHPNDRDFFAGIFKNQNRSSDPYEFYCSWNASKIKRRVHTKADAKVIKISGHFIGEGDLFVALCTPMLRSVNREYLVATSPTCFTSVHSLDLNILELCVKAQDALGYSNDMICKHSLYEILSVEDLELIRKRHKNLLNTKSQKGKVDIIKLLKRDGTYVNCLVNMYYCVNSYIICKYQLLSSTEAEMYNNYMEALTDHLPQTDGADGVDAFEEASLHNGSEIDSPSSDDYESDGHAFDFSSSKMVTARACKRNIRSHCSDDSFDSDTLSVGPKEKKLFLESPDLPCLSLVDSQPQIYVDPQYFVFSSCSVPSGPVEANRFTQFNGIPVFETKLENDYQNNIVLQGYDLSPSSTLNLEDYRCDFIKHTFLECPQIDNEFLNVFNTEAPFKDFGSEQVLDDINDIITRGTIQCN